MGLPGPPVLLCGLGSWACIDWPCLAWVRLGLLVLDVCGLQCASFGNWGDTSHDSIIISNPNESIIGTETTHDRFTQDDIFGISGFNFVVLVCESVNATHPS